MDGSHNNTIGKLIKETVVMLCKNGVNFDHTLKVQGLIGITTDDDKVFLVHINEDVNEEGPISHRRRAQPIEHSSQAYTHDFAPHREEIVTAPKLYDYESKPNARSDWTELCKSDIAQASQQTQLQASAAPVDYLNIQCKSETDDSVDICGVKETYAQDKELATAEQLAADDVYIVDDATYDSLDCRVAESTMTAGWFTGNCETSQDLLTFDSNMVDMKPRFYANRQTDMKRPRHSQHSRGRGGHIRTNQHVPQSVVNTSAVMPVQLPTAEPMRASKKFCAVRRGQCDSKKLSVGDYKSELTDDGSQWDSVKVTTTKYACKLCSQTFTHQPNLFRHQITAHGRQKKARPGARSVNFLQ